MITAREVHLSLIEMGPFFAVGLFVGVLVFLEVGRRIGRRRIAAGAAEGEAGFSAVEGAVFGLMGLVIAFTFSGATTRFDERRHLVRQEANAIGTAWLRIDLVPAEAQAKLRDLFRRYLDSRLETYRAARKTELAMSEFARSTTLQQDIWTTAVAACRDPGAAPGASLLLLPALNEMIDITTTRLMATRMHPPPVIFAMLIVLTLAGALLAGHSMAVHPTWSWTHGLALAAVVAATVYIIIDLEYPRLGFIRVDAVDEVLVDLRQSMD
jgi:hypothetical protein